MISTKLPAKRRRPQKSIRSGAAWRLGACPAQSKIVKDELEKAVNTAGIEDEVEVRGVGCMKLCCQGPLVQFDTDNVLYQKVKPDDAASLILTLRGGHTEVEKGDPTHPFFSEQLNVVLANSGQIDPERIQSYIARDGYRALHEVLRELTPKDVLDTVIRSGLRGRGGAGYPYRA